MRIFAQKHIYLCVEVVVPLTTNSLRVCNSLNRHRAFQILRFDKILARYRTCIPSPFLRCISFITSTFTILFAFSFLGPTARILFFPSCETPIFGIFANRRLDFVHFDRPTAAFEIFVLSNLGTVIVLGHVVLTRHAFCFLFVCTALFRFDSDSDRRDRFDVYVNLFTVCVSIETARFWHRSDSSPAGIFFGNGATWTDCFPRIRPTHFSPGGPILPSSYAWIINRTLQRAATHRTAVFVHLWLSVHTPFTWLCASDCYARDWNATLFIFAELIARFALAREQPATILAAVFVHTWLSVFTVFRWCHATV